MMRNMCERERWLERIHNFGVVVALGSLGNMIVVNTLEIGEHKFIINVLKILS
jgi:hypothetical protein